MLKHYRDYRRWVRNTRAYDAEERNRPAPKTVGEALVHSEGYRALRKRGLDGLWSTGPIYFDDLRPRDLFVTQMSVNLPGQPLAPVERVTAHIPISAQMVEDEPQLVTYVDSEWEDGLRKAESRYASRVLKARRLKGKPRVWRRGGYVTIELTNALPGHGQDDVVVTVTSRLAVTV